MNPLIIICGKRLRYQTTTCHSRMNQVLFRVLEKKKDSHRRSVDIEGNTMRQIGYYIGLHIADSWRISIESLAFYWTDWKQAEWQTIPILFSRAIMAIKWEAIK